MEPTVLSDGTVTLDALTLDDAAALAALDDEVAQWAFTREPRTLESATKIIRKAQSQWGRRSSVRRWAIRVGEPPALAGTLVLHPSAWGPGQAVEAELGAAFRGAKIGRRALLIACRFAFESIDAPWVEVETRSGNAAAQLAAIAVGFEGLEQYRMTLAGERMVAARLSVETWRERWGDAATVQP